MPDLTLEQLGAALERVGSLMPVLEREVRDGIALAVWDGLFPASPVGSAARHDPHPGKYRASHTISADGTYKLLADAPAYSIPGDDEAEAALAAIPYDGPVYLGNAVPASDKRPDSSYAPALEAGHSPQAAEGIYGPVLEKVEGRQEEILAAAVAKVEAMVTG